MTRFRLIVVLLATIGLLSPLEAQQFRQPPPYRILITNDDGVRAPGLAAVAQALQAIGSPIVVAPADNQTGKGHSIVTTEPVFRQDLTLPNGLPAIGLTATPASTVNIAIRNILMPRPDLVVSGVNPGYNFGHSVHMSGTVGAARMAAMLGVPAISISQDAAAFQKEMVFAAEEAIWVARRVKAYGLPAGTFLNVNVPEGVIKGVRATVQARRNHITKVAQRLDPRGRPYFWIEEASDEWDFDEQSDHNAVKSGYISVTPLQPDLTDHNALAQVSALVGK